MIEITYIYIYVLYLNVFVQHLVGVQTFLNPGHVCVFLCCMFRGQNKQKESATLFGEITDIYIKYT